MKDTLGIEITQSVLFDYLKKQGIAFRLNDGDKRIAPRIGEISQEYRENFRPLQGGLVHRKEFQRILHKNCEIWGQELVFHGSITYSIHCASRNENAVIIFDQLDALRWTQANSSEALARS